MGCISHPICDCFVGGGIKSGESTTSMKDGNPLVIVCNVAGIARMLEAVGKRDLVAGMGRHCGWGDADLRARWHGEDRERCLANAGGAMAKLSPSIKKGYNLLIRV